MTWGCRVYYGTKDPRVPSGQGPQLTAVVTWHPQILANQLTLSQPGGSSLLHDTSGFSDSPTAMMVSTYLPTYLLTFWVMLTLKAYYV